MGTGRKGQILLFQHVLLFTIGVALFMILLVVFNIYQAHYNTQAVNDQIKSVRDVLVSNIIKLLEKEGDSSVVIELPQKLGDEEYSIELTNAGLNITTLKTGTSLFSNMFHINETETGGQKPEFRGRAISRRGQLIIFKTGRTIIIS
ncbi:MAG: hypothetical protein HY518_01480 [Candidatus Aenigmarchaeota archaeon]|nr:hypothetical protein [Candidatus Aenigmarchaeota archaeon]